MPDFFSPSWAESVREALAAGPSEQARAGKLQEYWAFFDLIKSVYPASWALGCREMASYLFVQWGGGTVTDCRIIGPDEPLKAIYFFVESLAVIGSVPGVYPETLRWIRGG
jgi:hypothetical protein